MAKLFGAHFNQEVRFSSAVKQLLSEYLIASLCGSVGKDFFYHACGHEFESRLK